MHLVRTNSDMVAMFPNLRNVNDDRLLDLTYSHSIETGQTTIFTHIYQVIPDSDQVPFGKPPTGCQRDKIKSPLGVEILDASLIVDWLRAQD